MKKVVYHISSLKFIDKKYKHHGGKNFKFTWAPRRQLSQAVVEFRQVLESKISPKYSNLKKI